MAKRTPNHARDQLHSIIMNPEVRPRLREEAKWLLEILPPMATSYEDAFCFMLGLLAGKTDRIETMQEELDARRAAQDGAPGR